MKSDNIIELARKNKDSELLLEISNINSNTIEDRRNAYNALRWASHHDNLEVVEKLIEKFNLFVTYNCLINSTISTNYKLKKILFTYTDKDEVSKLLNQCGHSYIVKILNIYSNEKDILEKNTLKELVYCILDKYNSADLSILNNYLIKSNRLNNILIKECMNVHFEKKALEEQITNPKLNIRNKIKI